MTHDAAETLGIQALAWLAADDDLFAVFLGASGASAAEVKAQAGDPAFLGAVLDFLLMDDAWVIAVSDQLGLPYDALFQIRQNLPGGDLPNWT